MSTCWVVEIISRKEAREDGLKRYFTGYPCYRGHLAERLVSNKMCKICAKEKRRVFYNNNKEKENESGKIYRMNNPEYFKEYHKKYRIDNKIKLNEKSREYGKKNCKYLSEYMKFKKNNDINFRIGCRLRNRIWGAIKNNYKAGSSISDLGCSIEELKRHIETQFTLDMSWENWGPDTWHIDHIKPLVSFDLSDREQFLKACNYTNLRPLYSKDNFLKGGRF